MIEIRKDINLLKPEMRTSVANIQSYLFLYNLPLKLFETFRTAERQAQLVKDGYSKTLNSKHLIGEAADFVVCDGGKWSWDYEKYKLQYNMLGVIIRHVGLIWGGDFKSIFDPCHAEKNK